MTSALDRIAAALSERYTLVRELGAGGMATVYLAEDLKHDRRVAIKVLKPELAAVLGAERFVQEIKTTAALSHPHILPLFDSGTADGQLYYVMPYIEGETIRDRLNRETQLGIAEAVRIAREAADALDYAHRHGIIHRDIKPENILLHDGRPMVMDFGIALAVSAAAGGRMTESGMSLGTPHYMSPEQATADRDITARSDIYSLGTVLYEMLTGEPPHLGTSAQQIIMKIVTEDAQPVTRLRKSVPRNVAAAVEKALERLPADRFATAHEFDLALADPEFTTGTLGATAYASAPRRAGALLAIVAVVAALAGLLAGWAVGGRGVRNATEPLHATLPLGDSVVFRTIQNAALAISPDGRQVAFVGTDGGATGIWVRELGSDRARLLPGSTGGVAPFFSPDGASIGFITMTGDGADIVATPSSGGAIRTIVKGGSSGYGASWGDDGFIYFSDDSTLLSRVPETGGTSTVVAQPDSASGIRELDYPDVLPGSRHAIVQLWKGSVGVNAVGLVDLRTGAIRELASGTYGRYVDPGYVAIANAAGDITVARFDAGKDTMLRSTPTLVLSHVQRESSGGTVAFGVARNGTLAFVAGRSGGDRLVWVTREGAITPVDSTLRGTIATVALSPGGRSLALSRSDAGAEGLWIKRLPSGALTRLSLDEAGADRPVWMPGGQSVAYMGIRDGRRMVWARRADGSDVDARAVSPIGLELDEVEFDPQGRFIVFRTYGFGKGRRHLLIMRRDGDSVPAPLVRSTYDHYAPAISPDGNWIAYVSEESGSPEVMVRPFPNADSARFAISVRGGGEPVWRGDGRELFYRDPRGALMAVAISTSPTFSAEQPRELFLRPSLLVGQYHRSYDVDAAGQRFVMIETVNQDHAQLSLVLGWRQQLERARVR